MEVFLKNVPVSLTDESLYKEILPFANVLGIFDWVVDKPKRKPFATISFLNVGEAIQFLKRHGTKDGIPRLHIVSAPINVVKSRNDVSQLTLQHLQHLYNERQQRRTGPDKVLQSTPAVSCRLQEVSCGKMILLPPNSQLNFIPQTFHRAEAYAKFGRQSLMLTWDGTVRLEILNVTVIGLIEDHGAQTLTLVLEEPPRVFVKRTSADPNEAGKWERETFHSSWPNHGKFVAHCLVYQLKPASEYYRITRSLKNQDILTITRENIRFSGLVIPPHLDYTAGITSFEGKMQSLATTNPRNICLPFPILFKIQTLVWNNYLHPCSGVRMLELATEMARDAIRHGKPLPLTVDAIRQLLPKIPYPVSDFDPSRIDPQAILDMAVKTERESCLGDPSRVEVYGRRLPANQAWVFKAMVTPTRIFLQGPEAESRNRVLRLHSERGDYFLRVSFCDEGGSDLQLSPKVSLAPIYKRYRKILTDGIRIAGRQFSFMGFSHSSLRSHSTWFVAPFTDAQGQHQNRDTILNKLGDFSEIRVAAKCAARIGQVFSETPYVVDVFKTGILTRIIPDVKSADGKRVFSDGVGTISLDAVRKFWDVLPARLAASTCFQIRYGGYKGMLALDSNLKGKQIRVRDQSMNKFPSKDLNEVGICDVASRPLRFVLNRQIIKILEDMGTSPKWFLKLQDDALDFIRGATVTARNTSTFLQNHDIGSAIGLPSFIKQLDGMDIDYRRDVFLKSVVEQVVLHELRLLKHKARIPVELGVTLFGVMDETGFLEEGEVYVTYDEEKHRGQRRVRIDDKLMDGPILITRCPALHPGDVQQVKMRSPPRSHPLRSLKNCVVFSQKGARDIPSQLSGGDLDGDKYNIIWDPGARPRRVFSPADYARVDPPTLSRSVTTNDIADFFIEFMKSDILGLIAIRHQILADVEVRGTCDPKCIKLAELHSCAVDYSKTGIAVNWQDMPKPPRSRPDFLAPAPPLKMYDLGQISHIAEEDSDDDDEDNMGKAKLRYHMSEKILGILYRGVDEKKIWSQDIQKKINADGPSVWEQLLGRVRAELYARGIWSYSHNYREQALKIRKLYEDAVADNMWHFSENPRQSITEAEVFWGTVLNKRGTQSRQQREKSTLLREEIDRIMTWIVKLIREQGVELGRDLASQDRGTGSGPPGEHDALRLSWACMDVAFERTEPGSITVRGTGELQSFRVVAASCLLRELHNRGSEASLMDGFRGLRISGTR